MFQLRTRRDLVFFLVICTLIFGMGLLFLARPPQPLPDEATAYRAVGGTLHEITATSAGRRGDWVQFRVANDARTFELNHLGAAEQAASWRPGQTALSFYVLQPEGEPGAELPVRAYGMVVDGHARRALATDIASANAAVYPWVGLFPLGVGLLGYIVAFLRWRSLPAH